MNEQMQRAVALMDAHFPGWWRRLDLDRLDLMSLADCVVCQQPLARGASWLTVMEETFGLGEEDAVRCCFADDTCYRAAWVAEVYRRKEA